MIDYSIIIPHYDIPDLLIRCLRSIPKRDDVQVIVVDDGSPEADEYVARYPELSATGVEFYTVPHQGLAGVMRNIGLGYARGKWVLFVDADDMLTENADSIFSENVDAQADVVFCNCKATLSNDLTAPSSRDRAAKDVFKAYSEGDESLLRYNFQPLWGKIFRRDFLLVNDIRCEATPCANDVLFSAKSGALARQIYVIEKPLYWVTEREGSIVYHYDHARKTHFNEVNIRLKMAIKVKRFYDKQGINTTIYGLWYHLGIMRANHKLVYYAYLIYFLFTYPALSHDFIKRDIRYLKDQIVRRLVVRIAGQPFMDNLDRERKLIKEKYYWGIPTLRFKPMVVACLDSRYRTSGFADRLRGMVCSYAYAKAIGHEFRIEHIAPFELSTLLAPNLVDWRLREGERSYDLFQAQPIMILMYDRGRRIPYLPRHRSYHIYAQEDFLEVINKHFHTNYTYHELFQELFRPSDYLQEALKPYQHYVEEGYVSVSFRFMQLMGDLKDCHGDILTEDDRETLITRCLHFVEMIRDRHPELPHVLVTSDSSTFMERVEKLDKVFTLPGEIGHIGFKQTDAVYLKTVMDFYMISQAQKAYLGYSCKMYNGRFAESAALSTGIPYESIEF